MLSIYFEFYGWNKTGNLYMNNKDFLNSCIWIFSNIKYMKNYWYAFRYKVEVTGKSLPVLTNLDKGRYGVLIFENLNKYLQMDKWNRELLDKYCREYSVGIVGFAPPGEESLVGAQLKGFPLFIHTNLRLKVSFQRYIFKLYNMYIHTGVLQYRKIYFFDIIFKYVFIYFFI